jgi:hypothetical protein
LITAALVVAVLLSEPEDSGFDRQRTATLEWERQAQLLEAKLDARRLSALEMLAKADLGHALHGSIELFPSGRRVTDAQLTRLLKVGAEPNAMITYNLHGVQNAAATAMGIDQHHYVVNAFLEGYQPFAVENPWVPWYVIAKHKQYMYDHVQYAGRLDVWQTSRQAFLAPRGDCEDHAILLADWLISMGYDAWVAVGYANDEGHAWVVVFDQEREYLLEATQKNGVRDRLQLPLASLQTGYRPTMLFNREEFRVNTGSEFTVAYRSPSWSKRSRFLRESPVGSGVANH